MDWNRFGWVCLTHCCYYRRLYLCFIECHSICTNMLGLHHCQVQYPIPNHVRLNFHTTPLITMTMTILRNNNNTLDPMHTHQYTSFVSHLFNCRIQILGGNVKTDFTKLIQMEQYCTFTNWNEDTSTSAKILSSALLQMILHMISVHDAAANWIVCSCVTNTVRKE